MSSMLRRAVYLVALGAFALPSSAPAVAGQGAAAWDRAHAQLLETAPTPMVQVIDRWQQLTASPDFQFEDYASFLLANPNFPDQDKLRGYAEARLKTDVVPASDVLAFFARYRPLTNSARAHFALALMGTDPAGAEAMARQAWRGGEMSDTAESTLLATYGSKFTQDDQDARMNALLWQGADEQAERQLDRVSPASRLLFQARLSMIEGDDAAVDDPAAMADPGYLYNRSRELRREGHASEAVAMILARKPLDHLPFDQDAWVREMLADARNADPAGAERIAASIGDAFMPGAVIASKSYALRDDYTSLMWLGGTSALWQLNDPARAAPLFYNYGSAARTSPTRSKGFYWAGVAMRKAGKKAEADHYFQMAAQYPNRFYGQLALSQLGRKMPAVPQMPQIQPTPSEQAKFDSSRLTQAVMEVARDAPWWVTVRFYRAMVSQATTRDDFMLVANLARQIGRRDLAVILSDKATSSGFEGFTRIGYPRVQTPPGTNWTLVHAISRQESQFAQNAISHAGARGLMQLMPRTAREVAHKAGIRYMSANLIDDPQYNMQLGSNYIERLMTYYDGSYPLAIAAYNAGPGNVNKWLRANGDPRTGSVSWPRWIEEIPIYETKNYVQRVLENAVVYDNLYPQSTLYHKTRTLSSFLR